MKSHLFPIVVTNNQKCKEAKHKFKYDLYLPENTTSVMHLSENTTSVMHLQSLSALNNDSRIFFTWLIYIFF